VTFVTAGRVGSAIGRVAHFTVQKYGVKLYEIKLGRDGISRFKFYNCVEGTTTMDRWLRPKKIKLALELAAEHGWIYREHIRHNDKVDTLLAIAAIMEET
jgi:hypothetical protein